MPANWPAMPGSHADEHGFTLLEILVALTVLGVLMISLTQGVRSGQAFWRLQNDHIAATAELDAAARLMRRVFTSIPIQPASLRAPVSIGFKGRADQVMLVSQLSSELGVDGPVDLAMSLRDHRVLIAWARHQKEPPEAPRATVRELIRNAQSLEFAYWGSIIPGAPAGWLATWNGPALPDLIRIRIGFPPGDIRRWPDLVVAPQL